MKNIFKELATLTLYALATAALGAVIFGTLNLMFPFECLNRWEHSGTRYAFEGVVVQESDEDGWFVVEDLADGNQFEIGIEISHYCVGERLRVTMGDMKTPDDRTDDVFLQLTEVYPSHVRGGECK